LALVSEIPETRYVERGGVSLAYQTLGHGERDVLYLSWPLAPVDLMWDDPLLALGLRRLAEIGRLVAFDGRGWGSSDSVDQANLPAMQAWMDDIGTVLDHVGSDQAALVAMDTSALPLMLFAASHPERTSAVVLINAFARMARDSDYPWGLPPAALERWITQFGQTVGNGAVSDLWAPSRATDPYYRRWANRAERLSTPPGVAGGQYRLYLHSDVRGVLPSISAPTLVLYRTGSRVLRRGHVEYLASHIPNARLVELPSDDNVWFSGDVDTLIDEVVAFLTGASRPRTRSDRALATIVLTDIVGSTERAARVGDARWRRELDQYRQLAATHLEGFQGRLVASTGDGTLATFDGPARAIQFAVSVADAVADQDLQIRVGVHTGEVELMGDDIGGIAVHIAARVASLADPNEVLVSAALPPLVVGSDIHFDDRGEHKLKGVPGTWEVFSVRR
jgi:class 3 adenylate cyclase